MNLIRKVIYSKSRHFMQLYNKQNQLRNCNDMKYPVDLKSPGAQIKSEKLKASLARHQEEMERLIKVRYCEKATNI